MARFGSARIGENGKARGGQRGDQTGNEVMIQDAYMHRNGWQIIRAKDINVANALAFCMAVACGSPNTGYNQDDRYAIFWTDLNAPTNCDCSSLVAWCVRKAGIINFDTDGFYTGNEVARLVATGAFDVLPCNGIGDMFTGDILVDAKGTSHTGIITEGRSRTAKDFDIPEPTLKRGSKGNEVSKLQSFFFWFCGYKIDIDGDFGGATEFCLACFQKTWGLEPDGIYGNQSKKAVAFVVSCNGFTPI